MRKLVLPDDVEDIIRTRYERGWTGPEIAAFLAISHDVVYRLMHRYGIATRTTRPRNAGGSQNPNWKGWDASYEAMHLRVARSRGRPQHCEDCGTTDPKNTYEWANLTGNYNDPSDYKRLCRTCHRRYDANGGHRGRNAVFGKPAGDLSKREASELIDRLKTNPASMGGSPR